MKADIVTIFPDFFRGPLDHGITRRAGEMGLAKIEIHDLRQFTHDRHRTVDDRPFGGGEGMVLKPEPLFECLQSLEVASRDDRASGRAKQSVILLSAQG
ncbi:MAG: tRNA (guanosine(37)-N1)-methyltransferase TrmD, partial [Candidatus Sulfotelmatobacter sp.]